MRRTLFGGEDGFSVPVLGLGCSLVGSFGNPAPDEQVRAVLRAALDLGAAMYDTADIYGQGDSEREVGRVLKGRRDQAFVMTKLGKGFSTRMRLLAPLKPVLKPILRRRAAGSEPASLPARRDAEMREDFRPSTFAGKLEASLRRLKMDHVDALLLHSPAAEVCRDPEVWGALGRLKDAGKARLFGVSCDDLDCLQAAASAPGLGAVQVPLDVFDAAASTGLIADLAGRGVGLFVREVVRQQPGMAADAAVAAAVARPHVNCAIVGTSRPEHLQRLAAACV